MKYWIGLSLYFIITLIAAAFICSRISHSNYDTEEEPLKPDTVFVYKYDTIRVKDFVIKEKKVVDTVLIKTDDNNEISLPIIQKMFNSPNLYDIWVSGVEPLNLDSANIYTKTEYKTITNYVETPIYIDKFKVYLGGGIQAYSGTLAPCMGVSLHTKNKWLIEANFGLDGYFEVGAKYKIF